MKLEKATTACFSGYRPEKFHFPLNLDSPEFEALQDNIEAAIRNAAQNWTTYITG